MKTKLVGIALMVSAALAFTFSPVIANACDSKCHCHKTKHSKKKSTTNSTTSTTKSTDDKNGSTNSTTTTTTTQ